MARTNEMSQMADVAAVMLDDSTALRGKRICISGHLGKTRDEIVKLIEDAGGTFHDTIKSDTTHLLSNADWTKGSINGKVSSKFDKARRWGVRIISEKDFFAMLTAADAKQAAGRES